MDATRPTNADRAALLRADILSTIPNEWSTTGDVARAAGHEVDRVRYQLFRLYRAGKVERKADDVVSRYYLWRRAKAASDSFLGALREAWRLAPSASERNDLDRILARAEEAEAAEGETDGTETATDE